MTATLRDPDALTRVTHSTLDIPDRTQERYTVKKRTNDRIGTRRGSRERPDDQGLLFAPLRTKPNRSEQADRAKKPEGD